MRIDLRVLAVMVFAGLAAGALGAGGTIPNHLTELRTLRATYPAALNQAQAGDMLNRFAWQLRGEGFGLLRKDGGNNCPVPGSSVRVACDWIVHLPSGQGCDVLGSGPDPDAPGPSIPTWCDGEAFDTSRFVAPVQPSGGSTPPADPPAPTTDPALVARIAALEARIAVLQARVDAIPPPAPAPDGISEERARAIVADALWRLVVTGRSGQAFGHSHPINLAVSAR